MAVNPSLRACNSNSILFDRHEVFKDPRPMGIIGEIMFLSDNSRKWRVFFEENSEKYYELYAWGELNFKLEFSDLEKFDPQFAEEILTNYLLLVDDGKNQLIQVMNDLGMEQNQIHLTVENFPSDCQKALNEIEYSDIGNLITSEVLVSKVESNKIRYILSAFECKLCNNIIYHNHKLSLFFLVFSKIILF